MLTTRTIKIIIFSLLVIYPVFVFSQKTDSLKTAYEYSLKELTQATIITGTIKKSTVHNAPANITIITKQMIDERGYLTLVDICQDVPGFDFMMYNDSGGEYPSYSKNRGLGEVGNPEILIMINGIVQNNISFNWSLLWTYENTLVDVERIEIVQGPGSVMYGAQAFTGVINIITKKNFTGVEANSALGSNNTWLNNIFLGSNIGKDTYLSLTIHRFQSEGDKGLNRYDPGKYFSDNLYPQYILADYDNNGNYVTNTINPYAGQYIPDGFNTTKSSKVFRGYLTFKKIELGFFYSDYIRGNSSEIAPYEYLLTDEENISHYNSFNTYLKNKSQLTKKLSLNSELVYRTTNILPISGFKYLYRFPEMTKNYTAYSKQIYIEEKLLYELTENTNFYFGLKAAYNRKSDRIISLGVFDNSQTGTSSSWDIAEAGEGIYQAKEYEIFYEKEAAAYALWDNKWFDKIYSSIGLRYDYSTNFGNILNPRLSVLYNPKTEFGIKLLYGTAFRQPGIFELYSEFRGNPNLVPEKIRTKELELSALFLDYKISTKLNVFHSAIDQYIGKVADSTKPSGERYENLDRVDITGVSFDLSIQFLKNLRFYSNYSYQKGLNINNFSLYELTSVAAFKFNAGINSKIINDKLIADFKINYVGKRKAPATNKWIYTYENGYAPAYLKANFVLTYNISSNLSLKLSIDNVFNEQYYGLGRETGSGFIDEYDPVNNINPAGHIPAYHPQPGRTFLVNINYKF